MRVKHLAILVFILASTLGNAAIATDDIDFFENDFNGLDSLYSFVQQHNLSDEDVFAECSALIASVVPVLDLANAELHEMNVDIYLRLERSQGSYAKKNVNAKTEKYLQPFLAHTTFF